MFPGSYPTTTERGRGREMCAVVYHPSTKMSLEWTLKIRSDIWFSFRSNCDMWSDYKSLSSHMTCHEILEGWYGAFFRLLRDLISHHMSGVVKKTLKITWYVIWKSVYFWHFPYFHDLH
jgi:hypothetical protein